MIRKIFFFVGSAVFLASGTFILVQAQTASPTNFQATAISVCAVKLDWDQSGTFTSIEMWRGPNSTFFPVSQVTKRSISPSDANLTQVDSHYVYKDLDTGFNEGPGGNYYYQIRAWNDTENSSWTTPPQMATLQKLTAPAAPSTLGIVLKSNGQQAELTWVVTKAPTKDYGGFQIQRKESDDGGRTFKNTKLLVVNGNGDDFILSDGVTTRWTYTDGAGASYAPFLNPAKIYAYQVRAFESGENCTKKESSLFYPAAGIFIPPAPQNLQASYIYSPNISNPINLEWTYTGYTGQGKHFEIMRKIEGEADFHLIAKPTDASNKYTDNDAKNYANKKFRYKVRACGDNTDSYCSDFSAEAWAVVANAPRYLNGVADLNNKVVKLDWENTFPDRDYFIERKEAGGNFSALSVVTAKPSNIPRMSFTDNGSFNTAKKYIYQVYAKFGGVKTAYSNNVTISFDLVPIKGWAFGFAPPATSADDTKGIGWLRLSNDSEKSVWGDATLADDIQSYGVAMDKDTGLLSGYAWSGFGYGWLSFNPSELADCPSGSGCEARANLATGEVTGWAKFTAADSTKGTWDGWVSLRDTGNNPSRWGLCYGNATDSDGYGATCQGNGSATNNILSGWAWGNDVTGWVNFGSVAGVPVAPILKDPIISSQDGKFVTLNWSNGMTYSSMEIWRSQPEKYPVCVTNPKDLGCIYKNVNADTKFLTTDPLSKSINGFDKSATISGLQSGTTYGFFLRAYP